MRNKLPLSHEALTDIIDLSLWAGQLLLQHGAEADRVEETVHHLGTGLGCDWMDIVVAPDGLTVTATSSGEFRTKIRRVTRLGVNFMIIDRLNDISRRVFSGQLDRTQLREALTELSSLKPNYNRWLVVGMVGLACAAFSRLFGGDAPVFVATFIASALAMFIRQQLVRRHFNLFLVVAVTAFVAGMVASMAVLLEISPHAELTLAASVLLLVPGVPLINAAEDLLQGHVASGIARGVAGGLVSLGIAAGLALAMALVGVQGL
jgi:uncharacterized membrane protein YjjP (DUF1212 family)